MKRSTSVKPPGTAFVRYVMVMGQVDEALRRARWMPKGVRDDMLNAISEPLLKACAESVKA